MPYLIPIPHIEEIKEAVIKVSGFQWEDLIAKDFRRDKTRARNFICYFISIFYPRIHVEVIAEMIGVNRSTVTNGRQTISNDLETGHEATVKWYNQILEYWNN